VNQVECKQILFLLATVYAENYTKVEENSTFKLKLSALQ